MQANNMVQKYDRVPGGMKAVALFTKPSIADVEIITRAAETYFSSTPSL